MAITDPYPPEIEELLAEPLQHLYRVTVLPASGPEFDVIPVDTLDLTYDMDWSPYAQARLTVQTPEDPAQRDALDARLGTRVRLVAGYRHAGAEFLDTLATLRVESTDSPYPGTTTDLTLHGAELIPQNRNTLKEGDSAVDNYKDLTGLDPFIRSFINRGYEPGPKPVIVSTIPPAPWWSELVADYMGSGETYWAAIEGPAGAAGVRVYDDGTGTWHIDHLPAISSTIAARLKTGPGGTITSADRSTNLAEWHNHVSLQYDWTDKTTGAANSVSGVAYVASGPYAALNGETRGYARYYSGTKVSLDYARGRAVRLLAKFLRRGRYRSLTAAAAYWLRPGHTIEYRIGADAWATALVSAVTFSPLTGSMSVSTTRPEDYETGE